MNSISHPLEQRIPDCQGILPSKLSFQSGKEYYFRGVNCTKTDSLQEFIVALFFTVMSWIGTCLLLPITDAFKERHWQKINTENIRFLANFHLLLEKAEEGNTDAQFMVAFIYFEVGKAIVDNEVVALRMLCSAAKDPERPEALQLLDKLLPQEPVRRSRFIRSRRELENSDSSDDETGYRTNFTRRRAHTRPYFNSERNGEFSDLSCDENPYSRAKGELRAEGESGISGTEASAVDSDLETSTYPYTTSQEGVEEPFGEASEASGGELEQSWVITSCSDTENQPGSSGKGDLIPATY